MWGKHPIRPRFGQFQPLLPGWTGFGCPEQFTLMPTIGGPSSVVPEYRFSPKRIFFGTDPVAMDRLLIDVIEEKRKQENAVSIWDRTKTHLQPGTEPTKPNFNHFVREPGHIEMAANMGLGEYDKAKIKRTDITL